ncbi:efflux RND transporter periplasmic adaptor subunit [Occallatibacter savannae]|uniref:efflux RND transporter periplasmic adaptor subunit n=1 Tax=Occallatibacter savannae TaxID=1002691 RepID=UPI000D696998|nr:efflux RND transporter periplasmic adaptor subunit [Occallatibacter savannae]
MDSATVETRTNSTKEKDPVKRGPKVYVGIAALIVIVVAAVIVGPRFSGGAVAKATAPAPVVSVSQPLEREVHGRIQFLGQFSPVDQVELRAQVGGTLTFIGFKDGDIVRKGALLFIIDPTPYQIKFDESSAQVAKARARLELATTELARAQTLQKTDAGTAENVEQRSADLKSAQAALDEAEALVRDAKFDLDRTHVYAPFSGRMGTHLVSIGNLISGNRGGGNDTTLLATVVSIDPIYLNFDMSEADYLSFERGRTSEKAGLANKVDIALGDENRFDRHGTLNFLDNRLDRSSGTIHARATVPNSDSLLTPGEFGRVRVNLSSFRQVLLVPDAAVSADQTDRMVLVVGSDGAVKEKKVQAGDLRYGLRVIYSGIAASDRVIIGGPPVVPGAKVSTKDDTIVAGSDEGTN